MEREASRAWSGERRNGWNVNVNVNLDKIVKQICIASVLIVGLSFCASVFKAYLGKGNCPGSGQVE